MFSYNIYIVIYIINRRAILLYTNKKKHSKQYIFYRFITIKYIVLNTIYIYIHIASTDSVRQTDRQADSDRQHTLVSTQGQ